MRTMISGVYLRLWLVISVAFVLMGWVACVIVFSSASQKQFGEIRSELASLASVIASQIDPVAHELLVSPNQQDSPLYSQQVRKLALALQETSDIRFVYTMRLVNGKFYFVLDPTPPGDHDGDGVDDKSYLLEEYDEMPPAAVEAIKSGTTVTAEAPHTDRWGTFLSAFAPIRHPDGRVVAVLGIDREMSIVMGHQRRLRRDALVTALVLVPLAGLLALVTILALVRVRRTSATDIRVARGLGRSLVLEIALIVVTAGLAISAILGFAGLQGDLAEERRQVRRAATLRALQNATLALALDSHARRERIVEIRREAIATGLTWFGYRLGEEADVILARRPGWRRALADLVGSLDAEGARLAAERRVVTERLAEGALRLFVLSLVGITIGLVSLVMVRLAVRQQQALTEAHDDVRRQREEHRDLVEQLPIGLFTYRDGEIDYANPAWVAQVKQSGDENLTLALARALHPSDREPILARLRTAYDQAEPFELQFRLRSDDESVRYIDCRATPVMDVAGQLSHLVGFTLDSTLRERALRELSAKAAELSAANAALEGTFTMLVHTLVKAVEARDPYTAGHSARVMSYSMAIGRALKLSEDDLRNLRMGTLIHDVGKIGIPDSILQKPDRLTDEEYAIIRQHPLLGYGMIEEIPLFSDCAEIVLWHHERLDGRGYPHGLRGGEIPFLVRIAAVADIYDALTSNRAYRDGLGVDVARNVLRAEVEKGALDALVVATFESILDSADATEWMESEQAA